MIRDARREVLQRLKADTHLTALVPEARWYGQTVPADPVWPFGKFGPATSRPFKASCVDGANVAFSVHVFARGREAGGQVVESAEDHAARIGEHVKRVLADYREEAADCLVYKVSLSDENLFLDGEPDAFHWFAQVNIKVLTPVAVS